ncbi:MAG TPA: NUDIX domain-containing protein [Candidatus Limnocylindrales bacterium]|nr:NUDIX domain-containing protein [Candidatus Limnocylindrales bacterium]
MIEFGERLAGVACVDRPSVYAVARNAGGEIALTRTRKGYFLPGRGVDKGEDLPKALRREILEETGYAAQIGKEIGRASEYVADDDERTQYRKVGHFFEAILTEKIAEPREKDHQLQWCAAEEAAGKLALEFQAWAVREALAQNPTTI